MGQTAAEHGAGEQIRGMVHGMWSQVAPHWAEAADFVDRRAADLTELLLSRAAVGAGQVVLDLACGAGGLGLAAAARVGDDGEVLITDVAAEMADIAGRRAADLGLTNVRTAVIDLEAMDLPDASVDVAVCRDGLMFAVDPARAISELHRVVRPGGRVAVAVWGPKADNPWLAVLLDTAAAHLGYEVPPPGIPGPFSLADATRLRTLVEAAFDDVAVETVAVPWQGGSFDEWWTRTTSLAGPLALILRGESGDSRAALQDKLRVAIQPYATGSRFHLDGLSLVASGRRA